MTRRLASTFIVLTVLIVSCGGDDLTTTSVTVATADPPSAAATSGAVATPEYLAFRAQPVACGAEIPDSASEMTFSAPEESGLSGLVTAVISTSCGDITIDLDADSAPATVGSFVFLAEQGYFDGTVSHRVVPGFVIQVGDPTATGRGGPGYLIPDELPDAGYVYTRGTVAMANAGANTGGSQFFLVLADAPLPPAFSVFGTVTAGLDVMDAIAAVPTIARSTGLEPSSPLETIYIESIEIER